MEQPFTDTAGRKRKRPLEPNNDELISCTACRQRKTKCDRQFPCSSCTSRGKASGCVPDVRRPNPPSLRELAAIVEHLQGQQHRILEFLQQETRFGIFVPNGNASQLRWLTAAPQFGASAQQEGVHGAISAAASPPGHTPAIISQWHRQGPVTDPTDDTEIAGFLQGTSTTKDLDILAETAGFGTSSQTLASFTQVQRPAMTAVDNVHTNPFQSIVGARSSVQHWQHSALNDIVATLPSKHDLQTFVGLYFRFIGWQVQAILQRQIEAELEELELLRGDDRLADVDAAWYAMLFMVIAFGVLTAYENGGFEASEEYDPLWSSATSNAQLEVSEQRMADRFLQSSQAALALCDWAMVPSIRVVQSLCLHGWWIQHMDPASGLFEAGPSSQRTRATIALSHCRALGLHQLSDTPDRMPLNDGGFPPAACSLKRQMALRIWHSYKWLECLNGYITDDVINSNTADPALCPDSDLGSSLHLPTLAGALDPTCIGLLFCLKTAKFRMEYLKIIQKGPVSDVDAQRLEALTRHEMSQLRDHVESMPHTHVPPPMQSVYGFAFVTKVIEAASILRIRRSSLRRFANPFATNAMPTYASTMAAAAGLMTLLVDPAGQHLSTALPASMLYFLNAAIPLAIEIKRDTIGASATYADLLYNAVDVLRQQHSSSRNRAVAANANNAVQALQRLCKRLNTPTILEPTPDDNHHLKALQFKLDNLPSCRQSHAAQPGDIEAGAFTLFASGASRMLLSPVASMPLDAMNIGSWDSLLLDQFDLTNWLDQL